MWCLPAVTGLALLTQEDHVSSCLSSKTVWSRRQGERAGMDLCVTAAKPARIPIAWNHLETRADLSVLTLVWKYKKSCWRLAECGLWRAKGSLEMSAWQRCWRIPAACLRRSEHVYYYYYYFLIQGRKTVKRQRFNNISGKLSVKSLAVEVK